MFGKLKIAKMDLEKLLKKATEDKNLKALEHLKDAALHLQQYEIAAQIKKIVETLKLPEFIILEKREEDTYTNTVYSTHLEVSGDFIGLINTGNIIRFDKEEIESVLFAMNNKVRKS